MKIDSVLVSDKGRIRNNNQDNYYFFKRINNNNISHAEKRTIFSKDSGIFAVFDGMGGISKGEKASYIAAKRFKRMCDRAVVDFDRFVLDYIHTANSEICSYMDKNNNISMGTTAAILYVNAKEQYAIAANIGDSKVYHINKSDVRMITQDHNIAAELMRMGAITEEESLYHKDKNKLTQYLGIYNDEIIIEPYISDKINIEKGDYFIICSDGLTDGLNPNIFFEILSEQISLSQKANEMLSRAIKNDSTDNITIIVIRII